MKVPPEFWIDQDDTPDFAATFLEWAMVFAACLFVAAITGLLAGLLWGWMA